MKNNHANFCLPTLKNHGAPSFEVEMLPLSLEPARSWVSHIIFSSIIIVQSSGMLRNHVSIVICSISCSTASCVPHVSLILQHFSAFPCSLLSNTSTVSAAVVTCAGLCWETAGYSQHRNSCHCFRRRWISS